MPCDTTNLRYIGPFRPPNPKEFIYLSEFLSRGQYPSNLPPHLKGWRRFEDIGMQTDGYNVGVANSNLFYAVEGQIFMDFMSNPALHRLGDVRQLGRSFHVSDDDVTSSDNTRLTHSLLTAILADVVTTQSGFSEPYRSLAIASAFLHDTATPPFSDEGKILVPMDEVDEIDLILDRDDISELLEKYEIDRKLVKECIRGKYNRIGPLLNAKNELDIDRISYTMFDIQMCGAVPDGVLNVMSNDPDVLNLYDEMRYKDGWYFTWPPRAASFLEARAHMFVDYYRSPRSRAVSAFLADEFAKIREKVSLTKKQLIRMNDSEFLRFVQKYSQKAYNILTCSDPKFEQIEFAREIPQNRLDEYRRYGFAVGQCKRFDPATETRVLDGKKILPLSTVMPHDARTLKEMSDSLEGIGVYAWRR